MRFKRRSPIETVLCLLIGFQLLFALPGAADTEESRWKELVSSDIPKQFPRFIVPGQEKNMALLRDLFHLHYATGNVGSALWYGWIPDAAIWPALTNQSKDNQMAEDWEKKLSNHFITPDGCVASTMGRNVAHALGWPFPQWNQADGTAWMFSHSGLPDMSGLGWFVEEDTAEWSLDGLQDGGLNKDSGWHLAIVENGATLTTPVIDVREHSWGAWDKEKPEGPAVGLKAMAASFLRIECSVTNENLRANPYVEWTSETSPEFTPENRMYFTLGDTPEHDFNNEAGDMMMIMIPLYKAPTWDEGFTQFRVNFGDNAGATVVVRSIMTAVDSRHNVNNFTYVKGCSDYLGWTADLSFLRRNIERMRLALSWALKEFEVEKHKCVWTPWVGHDGRSGFEMQPDGTKKHFKGRGIGNAYFDILPFGGYDALTTIYAYDAIKRMAALEEQIAAHPEWNIPASAQTFDPVKLKTLAADMKAANSQFWNEETGRFVASIDVNGDRYDYGLTFVSLEAIHYGFATDEQAQEIMDWISGERIVEGDTSQGEDIYHWEFSPRCTTKRNLEYYNFVWTGPETIPWGGQIQDGGAVLGFSYHDLMSRIAVYGPDNAWQRLSEILEWYEEVQAGGGYRKYYSNIPDASLQGGGTAGGLGLDCEFIENILVPQVMLHGFMGMEPRADGLKIHPNLPTAWPALAVTRVDFHSMVCTIAVAEGRIKIAAKGGLLNSFNLYAPAGKWRVKYRDAAGKVLDECVVEIEGDDGFVAVKASAAISVELLGIK